MAAFQLATLLTTVTMLRSGRTTLLRAPKQFRSGHVSLCSTPNSAASLPLAVLRSIETHMCGLGAGAPVLISVSGGSDSVALLRVLVELNSQLQWDLAAVHFNHGFRRESEEEEVFVRSLAAEYGVPMHVRRLAEADRALANGVQERTRAWRRTESLAILSSLDAAPEHGWGGPEQPRGAVMLGHHADDQLETIVLKGLRGCHLSNLHGMRWQDGPFVRPLLGQRKSELVAYLRALGQEWREDASNAVPKYKRNRVRLQLLPLLEELTGGGLHARIGVLEQQSAQLREWLHQASHAHLTADPFWSTSAGARGLSVARLRQQVPMVQDEVLHLLVRDGVEAAESSAADASELEMESPSEIGDEIESVEGAEGARVVAGAPERLSEGSSDGYSVPYAQLVRLRTQLERPSTEWTLDLAGCCIVQRVGDLLTVAPTRPARRPAETTTEDEETLRGSVALDGVTVRFPVGWDVRVRWAEDGGGVAEAHATSAEAAAGAAGAIPDDAAAMHEVITLHSVPPDAVLELRTPRPGDRFHPLWREAPIGLTSFLRGQRVALERRRATPLVCQAGSQEVLAVLQPRHVARSASRPGANSTAPSSRVLWLAVRAAMPVIGDHNAIFEV